MEFRLQAESFLFAVFRLKAELHAFAFLSSLTHYPLATHSRSLMLLMICSKAGL
jgi:hypothetical protein